MRLQKSLLTLAFAATAALNLSGCDSSTTAPDSSAPGGATTNDAPGAAPANDLGTPSDVPANDGGEITLPGLDTSAPAADADKPE